MVDGFTETSHQSWFGRIGSAFGGVIAGIVMFFASFAVLWWNEGRAVTTARSLEEGKGAVVQIKADSVNDANDGELVHVTEKATTNDTLTDDVFQVTAANAIRLVRKVEMYKWKEHKRSNRRKRIGGRTTTTTTYEYKKVWSSTPIDSSEFHQDGSADHTNPSMPYQGKTFTAKNVQLGAFQLPSSLVGRMVGEQPIPLNKETYDKLPSDVKTKFKQQGNEIYSSVNPSATSALPQIGDVKVSFHVLKPSTVSVIAQQTGKTFQPYQTNAGDALEMLDMGTKSADEMFQEAIEANNMMTWILRLVGWLVMAIGLFLVVRPIVVFTDIIPFLGGIVGFMLGLVAALIAAVLSLITISIAWLFYRPLLSLGILAGAAVVTVGIVFLVRKFSNNASKDSV